MNSLKKQDRVLVVEDPGLLYADKSTEEGCLSLDGTRKTTRYHNIEVEYTDMGGQRQKHQYSGQIAQIIQHECNHLDGHNYIIDNSSVYLHRCLCKTLKPA